MYEYLSDFYQFWASVTFFHFIELNWHFFIFDFMRYILWDIIIVLFIDILQKRFKKNQYKDAKNRLFKEKPLISVIAPGKNEGKHIPALARSMKQQTYKNIEIIIVDDGSDDNTPEICRAAYKNGLIDKFFRNDIRGGKASAANLALRYCKGKFVIHLDADSHLYDDAVEKLIIPFYMNEKIGAIGGDVRVNNSDESLASALQAIEYSKTIAIGRRTSSFFGILRIISGAFGGFRKDVLDRIGGWDVGPGLDGDITMKFRKLRYKILFEPASVCLTNVPISFKKLSKQRYRWDRSLIRFRFRKHNDLFFPNANYNFSNFLSAVDNIFFNLVLAAKWWVYLSYLLINHYCLLIYILPMNYILYILSGAVQFCVNIILSPDKTIRKKDLPLILYLPLMPLYTGIYLRIVRTYAYIMEFLFKKSYQDPWNPWKVSKIAKKQGL